jgi:hypothetical protein
VGAIVAEDRMPLPGRSQHPINFVVAHYGRDLTLRVPQRDIVVLAIIRADAVRRQESR